MTTPERRPRVRKKGHRMVLASNLTLVVGVILATVGAVAGIGQALIVGAVLIVVSIAASMTNARARKRRTQS